MKLKKLEITNFRCFESLSIDLDEQLTVLVAKNGQGKSSVLDAIRIGLWSFVSGFDLARNPGNEVGNNISIDDVRMKKKSDREMTRIFPCEISLQGEYMCNITAGSLSLLPPYLDTPEIKRLNCDGYTRYEANLTWTRSRKSEVKGAKTIDDKKSQYIKGLAAFTQLEIRNLNSPDTDLPVIIYYGTSRLWSKNRLTKKKKKHDSSFYMRLFGYRDCLDSSSSYKDFADWFTWVFECYWEDKINQSEKGSSFETNLVWSNIIQIVQQATDSVLHETGWHTLEYSVSRGEKSLVLKHAEKGTLKVELLSDGIRGVLAMVGDIAYRCIKLNPHLGLNVAEETHGVVMIDEVDMHLHPAWQQTILSNLIKAFPKIQFIVTTHSPQVLTTVKAKCIRLLSADYDPTLSINTDSKEGKVVKDLMPSSPNSHSKYKALIPSINTYGEESKVVLEDLMHTSSRPHTEETDLLQRYLQHINQGDIDSPEVIEWRQTLEQAFGNEYSKLKLADMVISKWKAKRGMA